MSNIYLLFFEFFKVGLLTFGGGYASLPFLYCMIDNYNWFTNSELTQLIAISGLTPGPIGLNMATFAGFHCNGIFGSIVSSMALVVPMLFIASIVFRLYKKFQENKYVKTIIYILRPTGCALLCGVGIKLMYDLILCKKDCIGLLLFLILFLLTFKCSRNPIIYMSIAAFFAIVFKIIL